MGGKSLRGRMGPVLIAMLEPSWDFGVVYVLLCYKERFEEEARAYCSRALLVGVQAINIIGYVKVYNSSIVKPGRRA